MGRHPTAHPYDASGRRDTELVGSDRRVKALEVISEIECECAEPGDGVAGGFCVSCIAHAALHKEEAGDG